MALQKTVVLQDEFGEDVTFLNAYIKIVHTQVDKSTSVVSVGFHKAKDEPLLKVKGYSFDTDLNGGNGVEQGYIFLKTLPEFAGAKDC